MKRAVATLTGCALLSVAVACGSGGIQAGVRVVLEADLSQLPEGAARTETMNDVREVLERRLKAFDADFDIDAGDANQLTVTIADASPDEARELLGKTAQLEFRAPVLDEFRNVVCETEDGSSYAQMFLPGRFDVDPTSNAMNCPPSEEGTAGVVLWEPATGIDSQGAERALTGAFLSPNAEVMSSPPTVLIEFTSDGSLLFEQITTRLVGFPLGLFLDDELVAAPTVQQAIAGGQSTLTGLDIDEARTLAIQLNSGALPVPLRAISEEAIP